MPEDEAEIFARAGAEALGGEGEGGTFSWEEVERDFGLEWAVGSVKERDGLDAVWEWAGRVI